MTSLNLGRPFHSTAGRRLRRLPEKPASRLAISCSSSLLPNKFKRAYTSVMIVPTGVGAAIGGYAGDALPVARTLASVVDCLISHPNVLNAAMLYWPMPNVLYVEGYALDRFAEGLWALQPVHQNKVGLVLDAGIEEELRIRHLQVVDATRASLGLPIVEYTVTDAALQVEKWIDPKSGQSTGRIQRPDSLLRAVETLVERSGVNAIAVVARFPDDDADDDVENYRQGKGTHFAMLLAWLSTAPQYLSELQFFRKDCILASDVDSVILPIDACGGDGALAFGSRKTNTPLLIAVEENETVLSDTPEKLGIPAKKEQDYPFFMEVSQNSPATSLHHSHRITYLALHYIHTLALIFALGDLRRSSKARNKGYINTTSHEICNEVTMKEAMQTASSAK
ncbi:UNVERIFIED_CONTAM: putative lipoprotein [Sesamum radiatum]|uniref:Lipoprotein n=1 Tax=Sesamum radiatum TaxID=300843 RepID=A0AAW2PNH5_SESRA